jgi:hypothetical protein
MINLSYNAYIQQTVTAFILVQLFSSDFSSTSVANLVIVYVKIIIDVLVTQITKCLPERLHAMNYFDYAHDFIYPRQMITI